MPGGQPEAWEALAPIFRAIAAKADDGEPCVEHMGPGGAGHYVKMVHNGIEYGDMQLIAEAYDMLSRGLRLPAKRIARALRRVEHRRAQVLPRSRSPPRCSRGPTAETGRPLVDVILDEAQQKGTGKWTSQNAFDLGAPIPTINAAVESRILSSLKAERVEASKVLRGPAARYEGARREARRRRAGGALREQDHLVRAGLRPAAPGVRRVQVQPADGRHRARLARRLHHPRHAAQRHHGRVPAQRRRCPICCWTTRSGTRSTSGRRRGGS